MWYPGRTIWKLSGTILMLFLATGSYAQKKIDLGLKGGVSIPNLTGGNTENPISTGYGSRLDFDGAIHVEFYLNDHFSLQPQLEYSSQGGQKDGWQAFAMPENLLPYFPPGHVPVYLYADYKSEARINYLMLPLLAKYYFNSRPRYSVYLAVGPFASVLLNAKDITRGSSAIYLDPQHTQPLVTEAQSFNHTEIVTNDLHRFNVGISGHVGIRYRVDGGSLFIEGGGNYGLIDIQKNSVNGKNKTGAATILVGYQFSL